MTFDQIAILVLLAGMLAAFASERLRTEVVALAGLAIGFALGLVPAGKLFAGFADPAVITVIEILLIIQVLSRTALPERLAARIVSARLGERATITILCLISATISVFMNNIGALALMLPVTYGVCHAAGIAPSRALMPISFATLLGGICSEIGTPANLIASNQLRAATGHGFALFDFAWAGMPAALAGLAAIVLFVPVRLAAAVGKNEDEGSRRIVVMAAQVPPASPLVGQKLQQLPFNIHSVFRNGAHVFLAAGKAALQPGDTVLFQAPASQIDRLLRDGSLSSSGSNRIGLPSTRAVVMPESTVVGSRVGNLFAFASRGVELVAVSPRTPRIEGSLDDLQLSIGDVVYLDGPPEGIADALEETEMLALDAPRLPQRPASELSLAIFAAGIFAAALVPVSPQVAFGAVVLALAAAGTLELREALAGLDWPILIMLAAMIPLGAAVESTGTARFLAEYLIAFLPDAGTTTLAASMLLLALLLTPFVNNAAAMIVLGPIAIDVARAAGTPPEPLLIAVAMGASIDFLTPFGHHNNTLVMGLGGYRFSDFPRTGWLVSVAAALAGLVAIRLTWISG